MTRARARAAEPAWQQRRGQAQVNLHQSLEIMLILLELGPQKFGRFSLKKYSRVCQVRLRCFDFGKLKVTPLLTFF